MPRVVWCPFATQDVVRSGAGLPVPAPAKIVHHTTEGSTYAGARAAYAKTGSLPHFTDSFEGGVYRVWQHLPIDQAATALEHPKGTPETNRANAIQIEHVGMAGRAHTFDPAYLDGMAGLCRWIEAERGVPRSAPFVFGVDAPRLSWEQWGAFGGHFGHCHVPANHHWDPGALDIAAVLDAGQADVPPIVPAPRERIYPSVTTEVDDDMARIREQFFEFPQPVRPDGRGWRHHDGVRLRQLVGPPIVQGGNPDKGELWPVMVASANEDDDGVWVDVQILGYEPGMETPGYTLKWYEDAA